MDTLTAIAQRHSTRSFAGRPVARDLIEKIVDAGRVAPTARNDQPWEFVVVTDARLRAEIARHATTGPFIAQAPACVVVVCRDGKYFLEDGCAATENILLAATALGVGSCWVAGDKKPYCEPIAQLIGVPAGHRIVALIALGYAAVAEGPTEKRPLAEVIHWERF